MSQQPIAEGFSALAHPVRLGIFNLLSLASEQSLRAGEIANQLQIKASTLSGHLAKLRRANLITMQRDGTSLYYALDQTGLDVLRHFLGSGSGSKTDTQPNITVKQQPQLPAKVKTPTTKPSNHQPIKRQTIANRRVLFIGTSNSARSILAQCLLNRVGSGKFTAQSAGTKPGVMIHWAALEVLEDNGYAVQHLTAKAVDNFHHPKTEKQDIVISLCDKSPARSGLAFPGTPVFANWPLADPTKIQGQKASINTAFEQAYTVLEDRIYELVALPLDEMNAGQAQTAINQIGKRNHLQN